MMDPVATLKQYWGYPAFRELQEDIIRASLAKQDVLALLPTGGGKSVCYQVPGLMLPGMTLVVSPLIALMKDQVFQLNRRGIAATFVNSALSWRDIDQKLNLAMKGQYKFLYVAPERLKTDMFLQRVERMNVNLLAVDESHCISQWGYDFRPAYLEIAKLRELLPHVPVMAVTATATDRVREDIIRFLELRKPKIFVKSFHRANLAYKVVKNGNIPARILYEIKKEKGSGIIYARTRKATESVAIWLKNKDVPAAAYHGGMGSQNRSKIQQCWIDNEFPYIAATNAFGMGIDKPDVRLVMHYHLPADIESYYQEAGRAGRDGDFARAIAFYHPKEKAELERWVYEKYPEWDEVKRTYESLCTFYRVTKWDYPENRQPFDFRKVIPKGISPLRFLNACRILHQESLLVIEESPEDYAWIRISCNPNDLLILKEKYPRFTELIDYLLRTFGGDIYSDKCRILPERLCLRLDIKLEELDAMFRKLEQFGVIEYIPATNEPGILFLEPLQELRKERMNWPRYEFLKFQARKRLEALLKYMEDEKHCRSRMISAYFGERQKKDCGICDNCRRKYALRDKKRFQQISSDILSRLEEGEAPYGDMVFHGKTGTEEEREVVIRNLMDHGRISMDAKLQIRLNRR